MNTESEEIFICFRTKFFSIVLFSTLLTDSKCGPTAVQCEKDCFHAHPSHKGAAALQSMDAGRLRSSLQAPQLFSMYPIRSLLVEEIRATPAYHCHTSYIFEPKLSFLIQQNSVVFLARNTLSPLNLSYIALYSSARKRRVPLIASCIASAF